MLVVLGLVDPAYGAVPVRLPAGERAEAWVDALALADLALGAPGAGPWVDFVAAPDHWVLRVADATGRRREVQVPPPRTPADREDLAWLAASLSAPVRVHEAGRAAPSVPVAPEARPTPPRPAQRVSTPRPAPPPVAAALPPAGSPPLVAPPSTPTREGASAAADVSEPSPLDASGGGSPLVAGGSTPVAAASAAPDPVAAAPAEPAPVAAAPAEPVPLAEAAPNVVVEPTTPAEPATEDLVATLAEAWSGDPIYGWGTLPDHLGDLHLSPNVVVAPIEPEARDRDLRVWGAAGTGVDWRPGGLPLGVAWFGGGVGVGPGARLGVRVAGAGAGGAEGGSLAEVSANAGWRPRQGRFEVGGGGGVAWRGPDPLPMGVLTVGVTLEVSPDLLVEPELSARIEGTAPALRGGLTVRPTWRISRSAK